MEKLYKIHPAIGVARLGNSEQYYIAPERGGELPTDSSTGQPVTTFRDESNALLKQAARFKVFEYDDSIQGDVGTEVKVGSGGIKAIEWTVHVANKKACWYQFKQLTGSGMEGDEGYLKNGPELNPLRNPNITNLADRQKLILDPGPKVVGGNFPNTADFTLSSSDCPTTDPNKIKPRPITTLGSIRLDNDGNLLVLAANGDSGTTNLKPTEPGQGPATYEYALTQYANNEGWFDDVADGPVTANLIMDDGSSKSVDVSAWCVCVPPKFAPQIFNLVTLYDTVYDVFVREMNYAPSIYSNGQFNQDYAVDYETEIAPILTRPNGYRWVANIPQAGISGHESIENDDNGAFPLSLVRQTIDENRSGLMPVLAGDNPISQYTVSKYLTLTETQYFLLKQWHAGKIKRSGSDSSDLNPGEALDRGVLENCVGGAFCPGIEITWICRNAHIYSEPFRIARSTVAGPLSTTNGDDNLYARGVEPGDLTKYMAQPWQADYNECAQQPIDGANIWWWPAQRPWKVYLAENNADGEQKYWTRGYLNGPSENPTVYTPNVGDMQMVSNWKDLGFILEKATSSGLTFIEVERNTKAIEEYQRKNPPKLDNTGAGLVALGEGTENIPGKREG